MAQINAATFRTNFPEFTNTADYPDALVNFWLALGYKRCPTGVWGDLLDSGVQLYTAHNITLERLSKKQAGAGGTPGNQVGPLSSKGVSKVSAGYDTGAGSVDGAGNYNLTNYGTRFMELVDIVGVVGIAQVGTGPWSPAGTVTGG